ncbi:alpha/beta fold hydrolase [Comamonas terrae]|uniref:Alpha/beta fold hydrolase n=1 Tax=Comamonas terrae TaxID=673548 RepID=A0ABW5ULM1_9BURK|nr:alpha/beta hydrolase [Comamonas terrae]
MPALPPSPPAVVLLPGLMCDGAVWAAQHAALSPFHECVMADYGMAASIEAMADAVLSAAPPGPLAVVGHSMGGRVAMELVRRVPERVAALVLMDTGLDALAPGEAGQRERNTRLALVKLAKAQGMRAMGRQWAGGMVHPRLRHSPLFEQVLDMLERGSPQRFEAQVHALLHRPDAQAVFAALQCPVLLMVGRQDLWSPVARHEAMAAMLPRARLEVLEDCGHMAPMEAAAEVSRLLQDFLRRRG